MSPANSNNHLPDQPSNLTSGGRAAAHLTGRLLAVDLGTKRVGVAVSDELQMTVSALKRIERRNWKDLLRQVRAIIESYDARALVVGLPLNIEGTRGPAAAEAVRLAENFRKSLSVPVFLQDERLTSAAAESELRAQGCGPDEIPERVDSQSAAIILRDFIEQGQRQSTS
jgi:putative Holliday junction resolvase